MNIVLRTKGLSKKYGGFTALAPLDLEVKKGEVFGYLGPNGAGDRPRNHCHKLKPPHSNLRYNVAKGNYGIVAY